MNAPKKYIVGFLISLGITLVFLLILSLITKWFLLSNFAIKLINMPVKLVCVFILVKFCVSKKGILFGGLFGLIYACITQLIMWLIGGGFAFNLQVLLNIVFCILAGSISGIIVTNQKRGV